MPRPNQSCSHKSRANRRGGLALVLVVVAMFGFGYALVPLYEVLCQITGLGGRTGVISAETVEKNTTDTSRSVMVRFVGTVNSALAWEFYPNVKEIMVHPGQLYEVSYFARNLSDQATFGVARPAVTPPQASLHFNKTVCFCFTEQAFKPHEGRDMPVSFVVSNQLPHKVQHITLAYTFFKKS